MFRVISPVADRLNRRGRPARFCADADEQSIEDAVHRFRDVAMSSGRFHG